MTATHEPRIELSRCLSTGHRPIFFPTPVSWDPFFRGIQPAPSALYDALSIDLATWPKLAHVYKDLQYLANLINENETRGTMMDADLFQNAIHSIQSRLLALQGVLECGVAECMRLGMLEVLTTTFRLPTRKMPHAYLASQVQSNLQATVATTPCSRIMLTWVLMMSVVSVFEPTEPWIASLWYSLVDEQSWDALRDILRRLIWIRCIHDEIGRKAFVQLEQRRYTGI